MNLHYLSLIDKIDDIKHDIREDKYLDLMNTIKILYDNRFSSKIDDTDSDILIESGETTNILHNWIRSIRRFLPNDINSILNLR